MSGGFNVENIITSHKKENGIKHILGQLKTIHGKTHQSIALAK